MPHADRHSATTGLLQWFDYQHLPEQVQTISQICHDAAHEMVRRLPDGPELSAGLSKLLEAKDCFVRAAFDRPAQGSSSEPEQALSAWASIKRDDLIRAAHAAGVSKNHIHTITGIARTTIDRILKAP